MALLSPSVGCEHVECTCSTEVERSRMWPCSKPHSEHDHVLAQSPLLSNPRLAVSVHFIRCIRLRVSAAYELTPRLSVFDSLNRTCCYHMRQHLWLEALHAPRVSCTRRLRPVSAAPRRATLVVSPAYLWSHLHCFQSTCRHHRCNGSSHIATASFATSSTPTSSPLPPKQRYRLARDRLKLIRALQRESNTLRVLSLTDSYRRLIAPVPHLNLMIDTDRAHTNPHALNHACMSPHATPLDYCMLIYHLLRVGAMERAAALINEMNIKRLSIRAAIRALFAHQLVAAGRHDKAREMLVPNLGDAAKPFLLDKADLQAERVQALVLPPSVAILLMSPDDSPFFRSDLFHDTRVKQYERWKRKQVEDKEDKEEAEQAVETWTVPWENVLQCFDFLRAGGHLQPHIDCYHHVMQRLAEVGQVAHCRRLLVAMQQDGVAPTTASYLHLMQALLREQLGPIPLSTLIRDKNNTMRQSQKQDEADTAHGTAAAESRQRQVVKLQLLSLHHEML